MADLGDPRYVRFTNFKRDGAAVSTPVWFAKHGSDYVFSTNPDAGKVKRLRNDPRVEIAASDVRGRVAAGTSIFSGTARVLDDGDAADAERTLSRKYGLQWKVMTFGDVLRGLVGKARGSSYIAVTLGEVIRTE